MLDKLWCANDMVYFSSSRRRDRFRPAEALLRENNKKEIHSGEKAVGCISDEHTQKPGCWDSKPLFDHLLWKV